MYSQQEITNHTQKLALNVFFTRACHRAGLKHINPHDLSAFKYNIS